MLEVNYEYKGGVLFVRLIGIIDIRNIYLLINSIKQVIRIGGIIYTVINLEKAKVFNDSYIQLIIKEINDNCIYLCGYKSSNCIEKYLLNRENNIFNCINI